MKTIIISLIYLFYVLVIAKRQEHKIKELQDRVLELEIDFMDKEYSVNKFFEKWGERS